MHHPGRIIARTTLYISRFFISPSSSPEFAGLMRRRNFDSGPLDDEPRHPGGNDPPDRLLVRRWRRPPPHSGMHFRRVARLPLHTSCSYGARAHTPLCRGAAGQNRARFRRGSHARDDDRARRGSRINNPPRETRGASVKVARKCTVSVDRTYSRNNSLDASPPPSLLAECALTRLHTLRIAREHSPAVLCTRARAL